MAASEDLPAASGGDEYGAVTGEEYHLSGTMGAVITVTEGDESYASDPLCGATSSNEESTALASPSSTTDDGAAAAVQGSDV